MKKLLLVLFLCSLTSNALAKVEIWKCPRNNANSRYYKIDTSIPYIHFRGRGEWHSWSDEYFEFEYIEDDSIHMINNLKKANGNFGRVYTYDLVTKQLHFYSDINSDGDKIYAEPSKQCEVIE